MIFLDILGMVSLGRFHPDFPGDAEEARNLLPVVRRHGIRMVVPEPLTHTRRSNFEVPREFLLFSVLLEDGLFN